MEVVMKRVVTVRSCNFGVLTDPKQKEIVKKASNEGLFGASSAATVSRVKKETGERKLQASLAKGLSKPTPIVPRTAEEEKSRKEAQFGIALSAFVYGGVVPPEHIQTLKGALLLALRKRYNYESDTDRNILYTTISYLAHLTPDKIAEFIKENPAYTGVDDIIFYIRLTEKPLPNS